MVEYKQRIICNKNILYYILTNLLAWFFEYYIQT